MSRQYTLYTLVHYVAHTRRHRLFYFRAIILDHNLFPPPSLSRALFDVTMGKLPSSPNEGEPENSPIQSVRRRNKEERGQMNLLAYMTNRG